MVTFSTSGSIGNIIGDAINDVSTFINEKPVASALIGTGVVAAGVAGVVLASSGKTRKKKTKRGISRDRKFISKQKHERRYKRKTKGKKYKTKNSKKTGHKARRTGLHYTKNGQPYKILASGKARFVKKSSRKRRTKK